MSEWRSGREGGGSLGGTDRCAGDSRRRGGRGAPGWPASVVAAPSRPRGISPAGGTASARVTGRGGP